MSHLHPDHFIDLVALRHYLRWEFQPTRRVRVIGPAGLEERLDALHDEPGFTAAALDVEPITVGPVDVGDLSVEAARVTHTDDSHGFRVARPEDGVGLVYSGDCGRAEDLDSARPARRHAPLRGLVRAGPGRPGAVHLDGPAVGALAARTRAGRVLLTHLQMGFDEAATIESVTAIYDGPVDLVEPGARFLI